MSTLILTLPLQALDASVALDYVLSADDQTGVEHASAPLALLPRLPDRHAEVVLLLPAQALSWHQVQLPRGSLPSGWLPERGASRLRTILEGLLEDRLLDEPEQLHLALQPQAQVEQPLWVVACDRSWLKSGLAQLAQAGYAVSRIVPELSPEQLQQAHHVLGEPERALLAALSPANGVLVGPLQTATLGLLGEPADAATALPVVAEPALAGLAETLFRRPVSLQQAAQRSLQAAQGGWNLAQFDLLDVRRERRWAGLVQGARQLLRAPAWRPARLALLALLLCQLVGLNALAWREQASLQAKRQAIRAVLTSTFPKIPAVVDAPLQMAREVAALQRASGAPGAADLEAMLGAFAPLAPEAYSLTALDYAARELRLKAAPVDAAQQQQMILALRQQGLAASWDGAQWVIRQEVMP